MHTKGPWTWRPDGWHEDVGYYEPMVDGPMNEKTGIYPCIAVVRVGLKGTMDNARLIAAAPDLLEACQATLIDLRVARLLSEKGFDETISRLETAILKATAQPQKGE